MSEELKPEMTNDSVKLFLEYMIGVREFFNELEGDPKVILAKSLPALFEHLAEALELMPSDETLRASLAPVDVEGSKIEGTDAGSCFDVSVCTTSQIYENGWNDCIDHLAARGCFGVPEWKPIETYDYENFPLVMLAGFITPSEYAQSNGSKPFWEISIGRCWHVNTRKFTVFLGQQPTHWMPLPAAPKKEG